MRRPAPCNKALIELAERLIEAAGTKAAAHQLIDSARTKGRAGRRAGSLSYRQVDQLLILHSVALELEWSRGDRKAPKPTPRELLRKIVEACWQDDGISLNGIRNGRWNVEACANLFLVTFDSAGELISGPLGHKPGRCDEAT